MKKINKYKIYYLIMSNLENKKEWVEGLKKIAQEYLLTTKFTSIKELERFYILNEEFVNPHQIRNILIDFAKDKKITKINNKSYISNIYS